MRTAIFALLLATAAAAPVLAQQSGDLEGRVTVVEKQLRAVQRKVFPGGNPGYFEPDMQAAPPAPDTSGTPAGSAVSDLTARVGALEASVRQLTNQTEVNNHRLDVLEQGFAKMKADTDSRLGQIEGGGAPAPGGQPGMPLPPPSPNAGAPVPQSGGAGSPPPFGPSGRKPLPAGVDAAPPPGGDTMGGQAAVDTAAPATPKTGDPAEDTYMAGYNLWNQKRYPEAEAKLKEVVDKYPNNRRASYAQNLIGRSYLDDNQLSSAADAFLASYKNFPRGERAPESLYYLGVTLTRLKKADRACRVFDELRDVYGATMNATLKSRVAQGRTDAKCGA
jgi:TolA-binding protein